MANITYIPTPCREEPFDEWRQFSQKSQNTICELYHMKKTSATAPMIFFDVRNRLHKVLMHLLSLGNGQVREASHLERTE